MILCQQVSRVACLLLLSAPACYAQFTVFNTTNDPYELTLADGTGQRIASFEIAAHTAQPVPEIRSRGYDSLQVVYNKKRTLWQEFLQPFRNFLSTVGLSKGPLPDQMTVVQPANQTITQNSNLMIFKDSQGLLKIELLGPLLSKELLKVAAKILQSRITSGA